MPETIERSAALRLPALHFCLLVNGERRTSPLSLYLRHDALILMRTWKSLRVHDDAIACTHLPPTCRFLIPPTIRND